MLDLEFEEIKQLLKECGVKPGQILEVKNYLKSNNTSNHISMSFSLHVIAHK